MARRPGNEGVLTLGGVVRLGVTNLNWNATRDLPDATGMDSGGYKQATDGNRGATFSCTAWGDTAAGGLPATVQTGGAIAFVLDTDTGPLRRYTGTCRISSAPATVDVNGNVGYSVEATVEGPWVET